MTKKTGLLLYWLLSISYISVFFFHTNAYFPNKAEINGSPSYSQERVIVKFKEGGGGGVPSLSNIQSNVSSTTSQALEKLDALEDFHMGFLSFDPEEKNIDDVITDINKLSNVEYVEKDYLQTLSYSGVSVTNDTLASELWYLKSIDADSAWSLYDDTSDKTLVSVNDTGIRSTHPDLIDNLKDLSSVCLSDTGATIAGGCPTNGFNFDGDTNDNSDIDGHGTHVAGTIGAVANNGTGVLGVSQNVEIIGTKIGNGSFYHSDSIQGIYFAIHNGAKVVNMSYGGTTFSQAMLDAMTIGRDNGVLYIVAAGNDAANNDNTPQYPASYDLDNIISVASLGPDDTLAWYSNYGVSSVDVAAPGGEISDFDTGEGGILSTYVDETTTATIFTADMVSTGAVTVSGTGSTWYLETGDGYRTQPKGETYTGVIDATIAFNETFSLAGADEASLTGYFACDLGSSEGITTKDDNFGDILQIIIEDTDTQSELVIDEMAYGTYQFSYNITNSQFYSDNLRLKFRFVSDGDSDVGEGCNIDFPRISKTSTTVKHYEYLQGTSMATPVVAGVVAMVWSYKPDMLYTDVKDILFSTLDNLGLQSQLVTGGKVNAKNAIKEVFKRYGLTKSGTLDESTLYATNIDLDNKNITLSGTTVVLTGTGDIVNLQNGATLSGTGNIEVGTGNTVKSGTSALLTTSSDFEIFLKKQNGEVITSANREVLGGGIYLSYTGSYSGTGVQVKLGSFYDGVLNQDSFIPILSDFSGSLDYTIYKNGVESEGISPGIVLEAYSGSTLLDFTYLITGGFEFASGGVTNNTGTTIHISSSEYPINYEIGGDLAGTYMGSLNNSGAILVELTPGEGEKVVSLTVNNGSSFSQLFTGSITLDQTAPVVVWLVDTSPEVPVKDIGFSLTPVSNDFDTGSILWSNNLNVNTGTGLTYMVSGETSDSLLVTVSYSDMAGNTGSVISDAHIIDNTPPDNLSNVFLSGGTIISQSNLENIFLSGSGNLAGSGTFLRYYFYGMTGSNAGNIPFTGGDFSFGPFNFSGFSEGVISYEVFLYDTAGNQSEIVSGSITKDTIAPTGSLLFASGSITNNTGTALNLFSSEYPVEYELSGSLLQTYTGTLHSSSGSIEVELTSGDGIKSVGLIYKDRGGNISSTLAKSITLDQTAPTVSITANTATGSAAKDIEFSISSSDSDFDSGSISWSNNLNAHTGTGLTYTVGGETSSSLVVSATFSDVLGNTGNINSETYILDNTPPTALTNLVFNGGNIVNVGNMGSIVFAGSGNIADTGYVITYNISDTGTGSITGTGILDGESFYFTGIDISHLSDGNITYSAFISDSAGNRSVDEIGSALKETVVPTGGLSFLSGSLSNSSTTQIHLFSSEYPVEYELSGDLVQTYTGTIYNSGSIAFDLAVGEGTKNVAVLYKDSGNNYSPSYTGSILIDQTPPTINVLSHSNNAQLISSSIMLTGTISDTNGLSSLKINGDVIDTSSENFRTQIALSHSGDNPISYTGSDLAGNITTGSLNIVRLAKLDHISHNVAGTGAVIIKFRTDLTATGEVLYGTGADHLDNILLENTGGLLHRIAIPSLSEASKYYYKVRVYNSGYTGSLSHTGSFRTGKDIRLETLSGSVINTGSILFTGTGLTATGVVFSGSGDLDIRHDDSQHGVKLNLEGLVIESSGWDGVFNPPEPVSFSGTFTDTSFNHIEELTYDIGSNDSELVLSGSTAEVSIEVGTTYNGRNLGIFRSTDGGITHSYLTSCLVADGICTFSTDKFSLFTLGDPDDSTPDSFSFTDVTDAEVGTEYISNSIVLAGTNTGSTISVTGGEYSVNGGSYTSTAGSVDSGDTITVKVTSSSYYSIASNVVLDIGGVSDTYTVTTKAASVSSGGGGGGGGGGSSLKTCKSIQLVCKLVPGSKTTYKYYKVEGENCGGGNVGKICSLGSEEPEVSVFGIPTEYLAVSSLGESLEISDQTIQRLFRVKNRKLKHIDETLLGLDYLGKDISKHRELYRGEYAQWVENIKKLDIAIQNKDIDLITEGYEIFNKTNEGLGKYIDSLNVKQIEVGNEKLYYLQYEDGRLSKLQEIYYSKFKKKEPSIYVYKQINKVFHNINTLLYEENLSKQDSQSIKKGLVRDYIKFKSAYKKLKNKKITRNSSSLSQKNMEKMKEHFSNKQKTIVAPAPIKEEQEEPDEKKHYELSSYSVKLYSDFNFRTFTAWMKKGDTVELIERSGEVMRVRIKSSYASRYEGKEGYIFRKHLREIK